jgi:hypothetical protein
VLDADPDRPPGQRISVVDERGRTLDFEFDRIFDESACAPSPTSFTA